MTGNKLKTLANSNGKNYLGSITECGDFNVDDFGYKEGFELGFKKAFEIIDESLVKELKRVEEFPFMGERIMTLKVYKAKIKEILADMEKNYE